MRADFQPLPPKISARPMLGIFAGVVLGAAAVGVCAVVFFFNPSAHGFYPVCQFHRMTGLNCPGCGATRSLYALLHGNLRVALKDNALFILTLLAGMIFGMRLVFRKMQNRSADLNVPPNLLWAFLVVAMIFTVFRNLPAFSFLSP